MKKTIALLILGLVLVLAVCAAPSTKFTKYGNIFKSGEYTMKGTSYSLSASGTKTGTGSPLLVAEHAGQYYMEVTSDGEFMRVLVKDGTFNLISDSEKTIMTLTSDGDDDVTEFPDSYDVASSGKAYLDGKYCTYEKTYDEDGILSTYWYNGNDLYAIQSTESIIYIDSISQKADASLFVLPSDYTVMDFASLFSDWGTSDDSGYWGDFSASDDSDWSSAFGDIDWDSIFSGWDYDDSAHFYAFAILMGLDSTQAAAFEDAMIAFYDIYWADLNEYYDISTNRYDLKGQKLADILYLDKDTEKQLQNLINKFKK